MGLLSGGSLIMLTVLCTTMVVYPTLHELGHFLAAGLMGCKVVGFEFFCGFRMTISVGESISEVTVLALSGMLLPFLCGMLIPSRWFVIWVGKIALLAMNGLVSALSVLCTIMNVYGEVVYDDITAITKLYPQTLSVNFLIIVIIELVTVIYIKKQRVVLRVADFLIL